MVARLHGLFPHGDGGAAGGERALAAQRACGDERIAAGVTVSLGVARPLASAVDEGIALLERGLDLAQRSGSWLDVGRAYVNMTGCYLNRGEYERIIALHEAHLRHAERTGWEFSLLLALCNVGWARMEQGHLDEASALAEDLLAASGATMPSLLAMALALRGTLLVRQGRPADAVEPLDRPLSLAEHDCTFEPLAAPFPAAIHARLPLGRVAAAASLAERGLAYARPLGPVVSSERLLLATVEA